MATRIARLLGRGADDAARVGDDAASAADDVAEGATEAGRSMGEAFAQALGETPSRVLGTAANQPAAVTREAGSTARTGALALVGGAGSLAGAGAYRSFQDTQQAEILAAADEEARSDLMRLTSNENVSEEAKDRLLDRALDGGLFDTNRQSDAEGDDEEGGLFDNVWFTRIVALVVVYYLLRTVSDRYGG